MATTVEVLRSIPLFQGMTDTAVEAIAAVRAAWPAALSASAVKTTGPDAAASPVRRIRHDAVVPARSMATDVSITASPSRRVVSSPLFRLQLVSPNSLVI